MIYEQIEKHKSRIFEILEKNYGHIEVNAQKELEDLLKKSFIKYLQKELEQEEENLEVLIDITNDFARGIRYEISSRINNLKAQIKEIEG